MISSGRQVKMSVRDQSGRKHVSPVLVNVLENVPTTGCVNVCVYSSQFLQQRCEIELLKYPGYLLQFIFQESKEMIGTDQGT